MKLHTRIELIIENIEQRARAAFKAAEQEENEQGRRLIEHGAMCQFNIVQELRRAIKHDA